MGDRQEAERFAQAVAAQIRAERAARNISVAALARATGINRETLDRWVKGERSLTVTTLHQIASALGIDPHLIVLRAEERFESERRSIASVSAIRPADVGAVSDDDIYSLDRAAGTDESDPREDDSD